MNVNKNYYDIWEIEGESIFKADMFLIDTIQKLVMDNQSMLIASMLINCYWQGKSLKKFIRNNESFWEYILEPPIKIKRKVISEEKFNEI